MKKPSRFLRLLGVASLLAMLLSAAFSTALVQAGEPDPDPAEDADRIGDIWDGTEPFLLTDGGGLYFAWVGNDDESAGLGPADTSVSVQNLTDYGAVAFAWVGGQTDELGEPGGWNIVGPFYLAPWASKTFTAAQLGIEEGAGAPVAFAGYNFLATVEVEEDEVCEPVIGGPLAPGVDANGDGDCTDVEQSVSVEINGEMEGEETLCVVNDEFGNPAPFVGADGLVYEWDSPADLAAISSDPAFFGGLNNDGDCGDSEEPLTTDAEEEEIAIPAVLGGYAKQAVDGESLPYTTTADSSVSGYNAAGGFEIVEYDDWYLPIVQTNCGPGGCWDSVIRISNFGQEVDGEIGVVGSAAVTLSIFPADDAQGSLDTGFQLSTLLNAGDTWTVRMSDLVDEGFVGSAHIYSDSAVFAIVDRVKVGYSMWLTTSGTNAPQATYDNVAGSQGNYLLFAPDVRLDYFGWNTGINVANLVNDDNNVNIQYFNAFGNAATTLTRRLAPQGMTYFYDPSQAPQDNSQQDVTEDPNANVIGSALVWSDYPVAVAVDATKYPESTTEADPQIFQGLTYNATANVYRWQAFPLVQKGNPTTGMGATSGIQVLNPNNTVIQATVYWVNQSGFGASNFGQTGLAVPAYANGFVYTMSAGNLPNGFYGSAVLYSTYPVAAITTQVDYQVEFDGSVAWNAYNPCGYYRDSGDEDSYCNLGDPFLQPVGGSVTKIVTDENGNPVPGVEIQIVGEDSDWTLTGITNVNGEILWTNVPEGHYNLYYIASPLNSQDLPIFEVDPEVAVDSFTLRTGEDLVLENEVDLLPATKLVDVLWETEVEVCAIMLWEDHDEWIPDFENADCVLSDEMGLAEFQLEEGYYYIAVNAGIQYEVNPDFFTVIGIGGYPDMMDDEFVPELFEEGGLGDIEYFEAGAVYENMFHITRGVGTLEKDFFFDLAGCAENELDCELTNIQLDVEICSADPDDDEEVAAGDGIECAWDDENLVEDLGPDDFTIDNLDFTTQLQEGDYDLCYEGVAFFDVEGTEVEVDIPAACDPTFTIVEDETTELTNEVLLTAVGTFDGALWVCNDSDCLFDWIFDLLIPGPPPIVDDGATTQGVALDPEIAEVCLLEVVEGDSGSTEQVVDCVYLNFSDFIELCEVENGTDMQGQISDFIPLIDCDQQEEPLGAGLQQSPPILPGVLPVWFAEAQFDGIDAGTYRLRATNQTFDDDVWLSAPIEYDPVVDVADGFMDDDLYWPFQPAPQTFGGTPDGNVVAGWSAI